MTESVTKSLAPDIRMKRRNEIPVSELYAMLDDRAEYFKEQMRMLRGQIRTLKPREKTYDRDGFSVPPRSFYRRKEIDIKIDQLRLKHMRGQIYALRYRTFAEIQLQRSPEWVNLQMLKFLKLLKLCASEGAREVSQTVIEGREKPCQKNKIRLKE